MKTPFFDFWRSRKERGEILEKQHQQKLTASQLSSLFGDSDVRVALQRSRVASLLPPVGTEVFRRFTSTSLEQIKKCYDLDKDEQKLDEDDYHLKPAPELESGKTLPFFFGDVPPELRDVPLEDPDPFYQSQKTFVVVSKGNVISRFNAGSSCFQFSPLSLFRRAAIKILNHWLFSLILFVALLLNCAFMMTSEPPPWDYISELVFLSIYTVEAVLKIVSKGFCVGRFTYLRDAWDRLDLFIILTGFLALSVEGPEVLNSLRALKILGLFRTTRRSAKAFGRAVVRLWDVLLLMLLVLTVFSVIGLGLFVGSLKNKCVMNWHNLTVEDNATEFHFERHISDYSNHYFLPGHLDALLCGNSSDTSSCPEGYTCLKTITNPNYGFTNFDTFGSSFLSVFRLMMRDFWENLAELTMRANGRTQIIYFVLTLFFCSFSLTGLIVAAFTITFTEQTKEELKEVKQNQEDYTEILAALKQKDEDGSPDKTEPEQKTSCWRSFCSCDCCSCWVRVKKGLQLFVLDPFFDLAIIICLILNVFFLSWEHYPMTADTDQMLSESELVFSFIFLLEVVLKILAMGPYDFFKVGWHIYDTVLVIMSMLTLVVADVQGGSELRIYAELRLFRLARWWPCFLKWLRIVWASLRSMWALSLSLSLVVLFFSLFGMNMAGTQYQKNVHLIAQDAELPRWHMADFFHSFMLVTRALCGEWIEAMWDCMVVVDQGVCVIFYWTLLFVGNLLILTLFLSLLMKWISDRLAPKDEENMQTIKSRTLKALRVCGINAGKKKEEDKGAAAEDEECVALSCVTPEQAERNGTQSSTLPITEAQKLQKMKETEDPPEAPEDCCCQKCYSCCPTLDKSQGCGRVWSNIRQSCFNIIQRNYFNNFILFIILLSSAALVFEDIYLETRPTLKAVLGYVDQVIAYLFVLEMLFKWVGYGFKRYFTDGWCWLDFIVTVASVLSVAAQMTAFDPTVVSLKSLRPLRILSHIKGTRLSVAVLLRLVPSLLEVLLVSLTVWLFFAIVGVQLFAGKFFYCYNETSDEFFTQEKVYNKSECFSLIEANYTEVLWKNSYHNFDSVMSAYLPLFLVATFKGWLDVLYRAEDSTMVEDQPKYENNIYVYLAFLLFGCFFTFNHILKVLFDAYSALRDKFGGTHLLLTEKQLKYYKSKRFCLKRPLAPCPRPQGKLRGWVYDLVTREWFEVVMMVVIFVSVLLLMVETDDMSEKTEEVLSWLNFVLVLIFTIECALKIFAFCRSYFSDNLNIIDFVVITLCVLGLFLADLMAVYIFPAYLFSLLRLGRISRIIHLIPAARRLRLLFTAWTMSLPAIFNLALVLFVLMFTYASFGTFNFAYLKHSAKIDDMTNFETFPSSLICMFTVTTWAGWDGLLFAMFNTPPDCDPFVENPGTGLEGNCGSPALGVSFFVSYICLSSFVVLMMIIVMVVDMLNIYGEMSGDPLSDFNLHMFFKTWKKFDPKDSQLIQHSQLPDFCHKLKEPLRIPKPKRTDLDLPLSPEGQVHCRDVLLTLSVKALGDSADKDALKATIEEKYQRFMPNNNPSQALGDSADKDALKATIEEKYQRFMPNNNPSQESCDPTSCTLQMNQEEAATPVTDETEE